MLDKVTMERSARSNPKPVRTRRLVFSGAKNFRDLGGYPSTDGRSVRWNLLYRSDALHKLTDADHERLVDLDLERIIDLRAEPEAEQEPDRLPADLSRRLVHIPMSDNETNAVFETRDVFIKNLKNIDAVQFLLQTNTEFVTRFTPQFKQFLHEVLSASGRPVLFHCAAGKDRTGFAAAILLRILGVPHHVVQEDYLLTNQYLYKAYGWVLGIVFLLKGKRVATAVKGLMVARL